MVRPPMAAMVSSTNPASFSVSVWMATWTSNSSATRRQASMAAGVVPQSSCNFRPQTPARICSASGSRVARISFTEKTEVHGPRFGRAKHLLQIPAARHARGRVGAGGWTGSAADHGGGAVRQRFVDLLRRDEVNMAIDRAGREDLAFARDHFGGRADHQIRIDARLACPDFRPFRFSRCGRFGPRRRPSRCPNDR